MIPFTKEQKVLEVGGGENPMFRPNLDVRQLPTVDVVADLSKPWPVDSNQYDGVFSKYVIEHVSWRKVPAFVAELYRVLKPGGTAFVVAPNTEAQMKWALQQGDDQEKIAQCLFGDLDYAENSHKAAFNPGFAIKLFRDAGFSDVAVLPHGELKTDLIVEARKPMTEAVETKHAGHDHAAANFTPEQRKEAYGRDYFDGAKGRYGGYSKEGYRDFPVHYTTFQKIMEKKPESVLELGCARGYILKRVEDAGIPVKGLEVSDHCYQTRAVDPVVTWDLTQTPWPIKDKEFDLCVSMAVLEHIPESAIDRIAAEINRVSKRGLHGVDFGEHDDGFDKTHCLFRDKGWWQAKLGTTQEVRDKEDLEKGEIPIPPGDGKVKLNLGSFTTMFHHGWVNIDQHNLGDWAASQGYKYRQHDLRAGVPYATGSVDLIYACHFLEHLSYKEGENFLNECRRVLKPGGVIRIVLPDAEMLIKKYVAGDLASYGEINETCFNTPFQAAKLWELLFSGHSALYDWATLQGMLKASGFETAERGAFRKGLSKQILAETIDMLPTLSLYADAVR
jgi:predicted SAM-dependent methyltransferase